MTEVKYKTVKNLEVSWLQIILLLNFYYKKLLSSSRSTKYKCSFLNFKVSQKCTWKYRTFLIYHGLISWYDDVHTYIFLKHTPTYECEKLFVSIWNSWDILLKTFVKNANYWRKYQVWRNFRCFLTINMIKSINLINKYVTAFKI